METSDYCFTPNEAFSERNHAYGAYRLRQGYRRRLVTALALAAICFTTGVTTPSLYARLDPGSPVLDEGGFIILTPIEPPPIGPQRTVPQVAEPAFSPSPPLREIRFVVPEPRPDPELAQIEDHPPAQVTLRDVQAGTHTQAGDPGVGAGETIPGDDRSDIRVVGAEEPAVEPPPVDFAEQMPEFPGGAKALADFLSREIAYPELARRAGLQGRVFVQFVVGVDGTIRDVEVVRGLGGGCDEEAARAVRAMPRWIPGRQQGRAVPVRFSMPILFKLR